MKTLYLIRHGKASLEHEDVPDHRRPLLKKGEERSALVADFFKKNNCQCELLLSSHAVRAVETAKIVARGFNYLPEKIVVDPRFYHADVSKYFEILFEIDDSVSQLAIVAHNPYITEFANCFLEEKISGMPTSTVVCVEIDTEHWNEINLASYKKRFIINPKML